MSLLAEAKHLAPQLATTAAEDDKARRLTDRTWKLLLDGGFVRAMQPARWGGGEVTLVEFVDLADESVGGMGRRCDRGTSMATRAVRPARAEGNVGRRSHDNAFVVLQPDRQGRESRRRI
jgi:hypothetical protein